MNDALATGQTDAILAAMQSGVEYAEFRQWIARGARFEMAEALGQHADRCIALVLDSLEEHDWITRAWIVYGLVADAHKELGRPLEDADVKNAVLAFDEAIEQRRKSKGKA